VKRLLHPAVVQINVVAVTDVHEAFCCDAPLRVVAAGKIPLGEECALDVEQIRCGTELYRGECAEIYTNKCITND